jgi:hypothetical protein
MFAFIWSYPVINYILAAYTLTGRWVFDLIVLNNPDIRPRNLRRHMNCFVLAVIVFVVILYLVYMLSLPQTMDDELSQLFYFLAVFNWIVGAIVLCMVFMYISRLQRVNANYGKSVLYEAIIFIAAQAISGGFNFWLGKGGVETLVHKDRDGGDQVLYGCILLPVFIATEFVPAIMFAYTVKRWGKLRLEQR